MMTVSSYNTIIASVVRQNILLCSIVRQNILVCASEWPYLINCFATEVLCERLDETQRRNKLNSCKFNRKSHQRTSRPIRMLIKTY